jgi:RNA polymerase sigma-70 factor (ECF subfamily)
LISAGSTGRSAERQEMAALSAGPTTRIVDRATAGVAQWRVPPSIDESQAAPREVEAVLDYTSLFQVEYPAIVRTVALMLRDDARAEEIAQDAFVQLHVAWEKVSRYERPGSWVRRVAIRLAMRAIRRDRLWALVRRDLVAREPGAEFKMDVAGAIRQLPGAQRAAIVLFYYEDRPVAEIAAILGCAEATARVHLHRGRKRMAQILGEAADVV